MIILCEILTNWDFINIQIGVFQRQFNGIELQKGCRREIQM